MWLVRGITFAGLYLHTVLQWWHTIIQESRCDGGGRSVAATVQAWGNTTRSHAHTRAAHLCIGGIAATLTGAWGALQDTGLGPERPSLTSDWCHSKGTQPKASCFGQLGTTLSSCFTFRLHGRKKDQHH